MLENVITDSGFVLSLRWIISVVFIVGSVHKLSSPPAFAAVLSAYRLLPAPAVVPAAYLVTVAELLVAALLLLNTSLGSVGALLLLSLYTVAIGINLLRGRRDIDCGCAGPTVRQTLSGWLVLRNLGLLGVVLVTMRPTVARELALLDWFTASFAAACFLLLFSAATHIAAASRRLKHQ